MPDGRPHPQRKRVTIDDPLLADFVERLSGGREVDGMYLVVRHMRRVVKVERVHLESALGK